MDEFLEDKYELIIIINDKKDEDTEISEYLYIKAVQQV